MSCETCKTLLSEGLDLCIRARDMDSKERRSAHLRASKCAEDWEESGRFDEFIERNNIEHPHKPIHTKSGTVYLWMQEQYDSDLHDWETRSRHHLMQGCHSDRKGSEG